jgi:hypothetical protein
MVPTICTKWCRYFGECVFLPDEAWFYLSGYVNSQNSRFWSSDNPHLFHEVPLHSQNIGCWCAISRKRIVSPIFFSETVTAEEYQEITMQFISLLKEEERFCWLQQDGATSHTANSTMEMLKQFFDDRIIPKKFVATAISRPNTQITFFGVI